jgi:hypothetical protein
MPERDPEQSPDTCIEILRRIIVLLELPCATRVEARRINQVFKDMKDRSLYDLGYRFHWNTVTGCWYSEELWLDLWAIHINGGPSQPYTDEQFEIHDRVKSLLESYKVNDLPKFPFITPIGTYTAS